MADVYVELASQLPAGSVEEVLSDLRSWYAELVPGADVSAPILNSLVLLPLATREAVTRNFAQVVRDYSLLQLLPVDTIVDADLRTRLRQQQVEEWGLTADTSAAAIGELELVFPTNDGVVIPLGSEFSSSGGVAITPTAYVLRSAERADGTTSVRVFRQQGLNWAATIPVVMRDVGSLGNVASGTGFSPPTSVPGVISCVAITNFVGGRDTLDVGQLLTEFFDNRVAPSLGTRDQIVSLLRSRDDLGDIRQVGVVGFGDLEMHRDKDRFIPGGGGRVDLYAAAGSFPATYRTVLTAVATESGNVNQATYTIAVDRDVAPGFLEVVSVSDATTGEVLVVDAVARGVDMSSILGEQVPNIVTPTHGTFSRFQTATIVVHSGLVVTEPPVAGAELSVAVVFRYLPGLAQIQSLVGSRATRFISGDTLVRAAFPLVLAVIVRLQSTAADVVPESEQLRQAVLSEIYRKPMRTAIYASDLTCAMAAFLRPTLSVLGIDFYGQLVRADGSVESIVGRDVLIVPNRPLEQLTPRTIALYTTGATIQLSVEQILSTEVP